jgi:hypothetical protein
MTVRLEHANLCVGDIEGMIHFLQTAFPEFRVRGEGISNDGTRWVHIGTHETYIALGQSRVEVAKRWTAVCAVVGNPVWSKKSNGLKRRSLQPRLASSDCLLRRLDKAYNSASLTPSTKRNKMGFCATI